MPYRVIATDGLHLSVLLRIAEEYDEHALAVDATSFQLTKLQYWLFVALTNKGAKIDPTYIWGYCVAHSRRQSSL